MTDTNFAALGIAGPILRALAQENYSHPTPIQSRAIPALLAGRDILGIAQTGTGKTAAFGLPLLQKLSAAPAASRPRAARSLILAPTRELAVQIEQSLKTYGRFLNLRRAVVLGGVSRNAQVAALRDGVDILVATPGRLIDLVQQKQVRLDCAETLVVDEADRMLDMGFIRDVRRIVALLPRARQSMLFSATMPEGVAALVGEILTNPERIAVAPQGRTADRIRQTLYHVPGPQKRRLLSTLLKDPAMRRVIVFTRTKRGANRVAEHLAGSGVAAAVIHGNKSQNARQRALEAFRAGGARVLVATDIAARGIDIDDISHVVNFELPAEPESYVHRIGRTARAGGSGAAISFCDAAERPLLRDIERLTRGTIPVVEHDLPALPEAPAVPAKRAAHPPRPATPASGKAKPGVKRNGARPHWRRGRDRRRDVA